ncbi:MAG: DNA polymerase III subunit delta [Elusimicrobia bacterium]|nr:DNA polymerase III subunit delta [Elusimicrobiota bacterium]
MEFKPAELAKEWRSKSLKPVYYLVGEESSGKAQALEILKTAFKEDSFNFREFSGDPNAEVSAILSEAMTLPVFAERRVVLVSNPKIPAEAREALAEYLKEPLPSTTVVLLCDDKKPDPKDRLTAAVLAKGAVCLFSPLREEEAAERLKAEARKRGKVLSEQACATLLSEVGTDWGLLSQELEKILLFAASSQIGTHEVLECLGYHKLADPFLLTRLVQERKTKESLGHLQRLFATGKPEEQAFKALYQISAAVQKQLRGKRMQAAGKAPEEIFHKLRLHSYWDKDYLSRLAKLGEKRLISNLNRCVQTEADLKSKPWLDPKIEIEQLVIDIGA